MCKLISYSVPEGPPYYGNGAYKAVTKCEEHSWMMDGPVDASGLCPLGRIEKAVEDCLARLALTNGDPTPGTYSTEATRPIDVEDVKAWLADSNGVRETGG